MAKKQKAMSSDLVAYFYARMASLLTTTTVIDLFMENSHVVAVLDNGFRVKIRQ